MAHTAPGVPDTLPYLRTPDLSTPAQIGGFPARFAAPILPAGKRPEKTPTKDTARP